MLSISRLCVLLACAALGGVIGACGDDEESGPARGGAAAEAPGSTQPGSSTEASTQVVGGRSVLKLDPKLQQVLDAARVKVAPAGEASRAAGGIALPITAGQLDIDTPSGTIQHAGGLKFSFLGRSMTAENLVLMPQDGTVSARIDGERVRLFTADVGTPRVVETSDTIVLPSDVSVGEGAANAFNDALGVDVFKGGLHVGRLTASAKRH